MDEIKKGTSFLELYDILMTSSITDYTLDNLYLNNKEVFLTFMLANMKKAILELDGHCISSLEYNIVEENIGTEENPIMVSRAYFVENLLPTEKLILINFIEIFWIEKQISDRLVMSEMIGNSSEKIINRTSLKEKSARVDLLRSINQSNIKALQMNHLDAIGWNEAWGV